MQSSVRVISVYKQIWVFPKIGQNPPKWMVYNRKPYFLMDDLGGKIPLFLETPIDMPHFHCSQCRSPKNYKHPIFDKELVFAFLGGVGCFAALVGWAPWQHVATSCPQTKKWAESGGI